jgi:hypothetical protein
MSVWVPFPGYVVLIDKEAGLMHAAKPRYKDMPTAVCDGRELPFLAHETDSEDNVIVASWPPYMRYDGRLRCAECWESTGKPRPHREWRWAKEAS